MLRRHFVRWGIGAAVSVGSGVWVAGRRPQDLAARPPASSVIPVVGDGHWIWNDPPKDVTGYLEPRTFDVSIGIELQGQGPATNLAATTTLPAPCPEQKIEDETVNASGCQGEVRLVGPHARQLVLRAPAIATGQTLRAVVTSKVTVSKQYHGYCQGLFPAKQTPPTEIRRLYLGDSPGIQTRIPEVRALVDELNSGVEHAWERATRYAQWIRKNIRPLIGRFTSVQKALVERRGDCEEMSAVFVALCRATGIPARLVWVPNHNWTEFYLEDQKGVGHWIAAHLASYYWFGWTGAHELVLQKGDRLQVPERRGWFRLLEDWMQWMGKRPTVRFTADLTPLPAKPAGDAGPGTRHKIESGEWKVAGQHPLDRYTRR